MFKGRVYQSGDKSPHSKERTLGRIMKRAAQVETLRRVVSTRMPTRWGTFQTLGFERKFSNDSAPVETALAIVLGDVSQGTPLVRIHSQCFTSEVLGSLRCDCREQLEIAMRAIAE